VPLPPLRSTRLLDQVRERIRYLHYSRSTEEVYVQWCRAYIHFHGLRHPAQMGGPEVEAFLSSLATQRRVSASTHSQALSALLFLYAKVLCQDLPWLREIGHPIKRRRLPVVLAREEVGGVLAGLEGEYLLIAQLLYGTGMRISEALALRIKDVDFSRRAIVVREGKGSRDRIVMPPATLAEPLRRQLTCARLVWADDQAEGRAGVEMPDAWNASPRAPATPGSGSGCSRKIVNRRIRAAGRAAPSDWVRPVAQERWMAAAAGTGHSTH